MVTEDYVSFETAKLLKDNGFSQELGDEGCINTTPYYVQNGDLVTCDINTIRQRYYPEAAAPTLQMAMKLLREKYNIHINLLPFDIEPRTSGTIVRYLPEIYTLPKHGHELELVAGLNVYDSYEQACEAAIKYCLENII